MISFDTNVLVYAAITQDINKQKISDRLIEETVRDGTMTLSPLVISEFVFVLSKLKISRELIEAALALYEPFAKNAIEPSMVFEAAALCNDLGRGKSINDAVHLKFAEQYCRKIVTFDSDFKMFKKHSDCHVEILSNDSD
ncbi:MAG: type II toxin-antitoxin system VapC family toxin [Candidatus Electrothrix aestuarii]|uniref:Type II toxin-antitoxin system VapC family toxin n=1 Tax=Candidatus Electrothrix aestuarii TaxID=3062594 RepID=A0AAU8LPF9_9BACT|nr:type II toxin-antitoxin system VapC family toxin [Candidatus Electrothrix aestuarii]